jgi:hypothetical protein
VETELGRRAREKAPEKEGFSAKKKETMGNKGNRAVGSTASGRLSHFRWRRNLFPPRRFSYHTRFSRDDGTERS